MAVIIKREIVCDCPVRHRAEDQETVDVYRIAVGGNSRQVHLCDRHSQPLRELWNLKAPKSAARGPKVTTLEEIEKGKKRTKKGGA